MNTWTATWGMAHCSIVHFSPKYKNRTMRLSVLNNLEGDALRLRFSNREGKKPLVLARVTAEGLPVTFEGKASAQIPPGGDLCSDPVELAVKAGTYLTVSVAFQGPVSSGNSLAATVQCSPKGDFTAVPQFSPKQPGLNARLFHMEQPIGAISAIEVRTNGEGRALVCFGDSITQQSRWTEPLSYWLAERYPGTVSLVNMAIGGNRLLYGPMKLVGSMHGQAGTRRFSHDVLELPGAAGVIFAIGTNDIGFFSDEKNPEFVTAQKLTEAFPPLTDACRSRGMKVFGSTIPPRCGVSNFKENQEEERRKFNDWLRGCGLFDCVFDFDAAVRDPKDPSILDFACDSGDHLHPSAQGGRQLMGCIVRTLEEQHLELV